MTYYIEKTMNYQILKMLKIDSERILTSPVNPGKKIDGPIIIIMENDKLIIKNHYNKNYCGATNLNMGESVIILISNGTNTSSGKYKNYYYAVDSDNCAGTFMISNGKKNISFDLSEELVVNDLSSLIENN